ncbi:MAG: membrane dipeptidase [Thermobacillus sp. ZCTH02-B1]|uniref:dipeptidase n=1 Tax=Thermobacillus sp. ZCTH02-B1 TaxID=1858795 RepID=UPI000B556F30|nr:membrane dipeptidase [Thermobacillus sp. ZCTH02-B1]OUM96906.1 MAG: membrane dipeptidase [Thermobacillus sp. ZCTH02-B1]
MRTFADLHCDVLAKLLTGEAAAFGGPGSDGLDVTHEGLTEAGAVLQTFAVWLPKRVPQTFLSVAAAVDAFYRHVLSRPNVTLVRTREDLAVCGPGRPGALLALEGAEGLEGSLAALRLLHRLGLRMLGLTWNDANWAADGVMEPRGGGLTRAGRELVRACHELGIIVDVSHLSERAFWETLETGGRPVVASHSNVRSVCDHPRNLSDGQIRAIIESGGLIGLTFVPWFVRDGEPNGPEDLIPHIEKVLELGGRDHLAIGSDYDGIDRHIPGLEGPGGTAAFLEMLAARYGEETADAIACGNAFRFLSNQLPPA